jgi:Spy/CpxP family protein refolding chaperone
MSRLIKQLTVCAAVCLAFGSTAYAATDDAPPPPSAGHMQGHHRPDGPWAMLKAIHAQLNLSPAQEQLLQSLIAQSKAAHEQQRAAYKQSHDQIKALMQAPVLDLRALSAAREQMMEQGRKAHQQMEAGWLNFYDSLNTAQKTLVSNTLKAHWEKMEAHRENMARHWHKQPDDGAAQGQ